MLKLKIEVQIEDEQIQEMFENYDIKYSKAKQTKLQKLLKEMLEENPDILEEFIEEQLGEIIQNEWE